MNTKQLTYLEKFEEAVKNQQTSLIKSFLIKFNDSLTEIAVHNLSNSLVTGRCDQRGCGYYQPYLDTALAAMKDEAYH